MPFFQVDSTCRDLGLRAGAIAFEAVCIQPAPSPLCDMIDGQIASLRDRLASAAAVRATPEVRAFRGAVDAAGADSRKLTGSVEALTRMAVKRGRLPAINNLVDAYNLVSLRTRCSLGAHDLDRIATPVRLRRLEADTSFTALGGTEPTTARAGEFAYVDAEARILCRLDVVQADFSKVTERTRRVLLIVEATTAHDEAQVRDAFDQAEKLITRFCQGRVIAPASDDA